MAVGKASMARASKAAKQADAPEKPAVAVEEKAAAGTEAAKRAEMEQPVTRKRRGRKAKAVQPETSVQPGNSVFGIGDDMPIYYY